MPTENAEYISGLDENKPDGSESLGEADDHVRLVKRTIGATFVGGTDDPYDTPVQVGPRFLNALSNDLDITSYVTLDTPQEITAIKSFVNTIIAPAIMDFAQENLVGRLGATTTVGTLTYSALIACRSQTDLAQVWPNGGAATIVNQANWQQLLMDRIYPVGIKIITTSEFVPSVQWPGTTWVERTADLDGTLWERLT